MSSDSSGFHMVKVEDLQFEDMVDLQGDIYAGLDKDDISFQYEMEVVYEVSNVWFGILVEFNENSVSFPYHHKVKVSNEVYKPELIT